MWQVYLPADSNGAEIDYFSYFDYQDNVGVASAVTVELGPTGGTQKPK